MIDEIAIKIYEGNQRCECGDNREKLMIDTIMTRS